MKRFILVFSLILLSSISCSIVDDFTKFNMEFSQSATIPASIPINTPFDITSPDVETNSESTFEINDTRKDLIEEVKLTSLVLEIQSPSNGDFSFLESIEIFIVADGLADLKIASKDMIPDTIGSELILDTTNDDLKEYIKKDAFKIKLKTVIDELIDSDHIIDMNSVFFVDAKILGV